MCWMQSITHHELRQAVDSLHREAETTALARDLVSGQIDPAIYKNYCYQFYLITDAIEHCVDLDPRIQRRYTFVKDIAETSAGKVFHCPATDAYVNHIRSTSSSVIKGQLNGHIYTHYLGWLYGGQMIAKNLELPKHHLAFDHVRECVDLIRQQILGLIFDRDADEAKIAFEYTIRIYREIYELHQSS